jgi:protein-S-isoprenylcysteine O-methyltransferase Ste14
VAEAVNKDRGPAVRFPPPLLFAAGFLAGWLIDRRVVRLPLLRMGEPLATQIQVAALALCVIGLALAAWGLITFARARTAIIPHRPASRLVQTGPYRFTRNPMYVGLTLLYVGLTGLSDSMWPLVFLPFVLIALHQAVIRREERYLSTAFGKEYAAYQRRVRRWL